MPLSLLKSFNTAHFATRLRGTLMAAYRNHANLNYATLFDACTQRGLAIWREQLVPELGLEQVMNFEKALVKVQIRAAKTIPWVLGMGYAYGAACHVVAGGDQEKREDGAVTTALLMLIMSLYDHLLDEHPHEFVPLTKIINNDSLKAWAVDRNLETLTCDPEHGVAVGLLNLYRVYFIRCHRLLGNNPDSDLAQGWLAALQKMHAAENNSITWKLSTMPPSMDLIARTEKTSTSAFWAGAVSACLGESNDAALRLKDFSRNYARLTWVVDDVMDLETDFNQDLWNGFAVRLALEAHNQADAEKVIDDLSVECCEIVVALNQQLGQAYWQTGDAFSLADILWAYIWTWLGGDYSQHQVNVAPAAGSSKPAMTMR